MCPLQRYMLGARVPTERSPMFLKLTLPILTKMISRNINVGPSYWPFHLHNVYCLCRYVLTWKARLFLFHVSSFFTSPQDNFSYCFRGFHICLSPWTSVCEIIPPFPLYLKGWDGSDDIFIHLALRSQCFSDYVLDMKYVFPQDGFNFISSTICPFLFCWWIFLSFHLAIVSFFFFFFFSFEHLPMLYPTPWIPPLQLLLFVLGHFCDSFFPQWFFFFCLKVIDSMLRVL